MVQALCLTHEMVSIVSLLWKIIQWNLSIEDTIGTQLVVLYTVEPLYRGHHWDPTGCPVYSGTSL